MRRTVVLLRSWLGLVALQGPRIRALPSPPGARAAYVPTHLVVLPPTPQDGAPLSQNLQGDQNHDRDDEQSQSTSSIPTPDACLQLKFATALDRS